MQSVVFATDFHSSWSKIPTWTTPEISRNCDYFRGIQRMTKLWILERGEPIWGNPKKVDLDPCRFAHPSLCFKSRSRESASREASHDVAGTLEFCTVESSWSQLIWTHVNSLDCLQLFLHHFMSHCIGHLSSKQNPDFGVILAILWQTSLASAVIMQSLLMPLWVVCQQPVGALAGASRFLACQRKCIIIFCNGMLRARISGTKNMFKQVFALLHEQTNEQRRCQLQLELLQVIKRHAD